MATDTRKRKAGLMFRIVKGGLEVADNYTRLKLRERNFHLGDLVSVVITKINNPAFHRLIHHIGQLCAANIPAFTGMDAHRVLKRLQIEGNIACDEIGIPVEVCLQLLREAVDRGDKMVMMRIPRSLSFDSMDDGERHEMALQFCRWIATHYWPDMSPEQIEQMAESFIQET